MEILVAAGFMLALDQCTKWLVQRRALRRDGRGVAWGPALRIRQVTTVQPRFRRERGRAGLVLLWLVALGCGLGVQGSGLAFQSPWSSWGLGAALGGAAGNLLDILRRHAVLDFIDLGWWPVFNLADVGIVSGLALAFWPTG
jgi:signal peptidase II